ncbi:IS66 family insertion sequence element accessory protein TnpA, partial [Salinivibrio costicola]
MKLWQERLQHQKDSQLSIAAWCELHQIAQSQFYYWQKKLTTSSTEPES